jgi:hypothetical protein
MTESIRDGRLGPGQRQRPRPGLLVVDCAGQAVGRARDVHAPDPLAVADDGRRIGEAGDIEAMLPGWSRHALPGLPGPAAARLVREGYVRIVCPGPRPAGHCYAALTDIADVYEETIYLSVAFEDLPSEIRR